MFAGRGALQRAWNVDRTAAKRNDQPIVRSSLDSGLGRAFLPVAGLPDKNVQLPFLGLTHHDRSMGNPQRNRAKTGSIRHWPRRLAATEPFTATEG